MLVMKFGGSSIKDPSAVDRVAGVVGGRLAERPVVVVSALGKTTDSLVSILGHLERGEADMAREIAGMIRDHHERVIEDVVVEKAHAVEAMDAVSFCIARLSRLVEGMELLGEVSDRSRDAVLAMGELMAAPLITAALRSRGLLAQSEDPRALVITSCHHGRAVPDQSASTSRCRELLLPIVEAGRVPVVGGFVGSTADGVTTTLGRGGSDLTASVVARGIEADALEYWKDVDGILTADPGTVPCARPVSVLTFQEAAELAFLGAKVLHPASIQPAVDAGIPVRVKNSFRPDAEGTLITLERPADDTSGDPRRSVVSVACKRGQILVNAFSTRMLGASGFLRRVFEVFERLELSVDHIATSEVNVSVTLAPTDRTTELASLLAEVADVRIRTGVGVISVVGEGISRTPGVAAVVFEALGDVNVHLITHGGSGVNLSFVVDDARVAEALRRLHAALFEQSGT